MGKGSAHIIPQTKVFKSGGVLVADTAVKFGADETHVVKCGAGERAIGIVKQAASAAEQFVEVDGYFGGSKLLLSATVTRGNFLKSDANGNGIKGSADNDFCFCQAQQDGVAGDIIPVLVMPMLIGAGES